MNESIENGNVGGNVAPDYPIDALPTPVADMCRSLSVSTQSAPEMAGTFALGLLSACVQRNALIRVNSVYTEQLCLYTLAAAGSGERKSAVFDILTKPLYEAEAAYYKEHCAEIIASRLDYDDLRRKHNKLASKRLTDSGNDYDAPWLANLPEEADPYHFTGEQLANFDLLTKPQIFFDDVTSEKLILELADQRGCGAIASPEGGLLTKLRNSVALSSAFDVYLKGHSGDRINVKRVESSRDTTIEHPRLTLILGCQPDVAKKFITNRSFIENGFVARFLYAMCGSMLGSRDHEPPDVPKETVERYSAFMTNLAARALDHKAPSLELTLTASAYRRYMDFKRDLEPQLAERGGRFSHMREWGAKLAGNMLRIAGIFALCGDRGTNGIGDEQKIDEQREINTDAVERAIAIADWYAENAERLFIRKRRHSNDAQQVCDVLAQNGGVLAKANLARKTHKSGETLQHALDELVKTGAVYIENTPTAGRDMQMVRLTQPQNF
ncbi:hypothetical protein FACS189490_04110 [Clostridia bacterium]|nr:hypothetical protein FACS189490_04110 [Clostridia bacterium]